MRGKVIREGIGPEGEKGGRMREKGWEKRVPKARLKNSDFGSPMIEVLFNTPTLRDPNAGCSEEGPLAIAESSSAIASKMSSSSKKFYAITDLLARKSQLANDYETPLPESLPFALLQGPRFPIQGPRFPIQGHRFPLQALASPYRGPF